MEYEYKDVKVIADKTTLATLELKYYCDNKRHLICLPYSIDNLHKMAKLLGIHRSFYHKAGKTSRHPHYDIPKSRQKEIMSQCTVITKREILTHIKNNLPKRYKEEERLTGYKTRR